MAPSKLYQYAKNNISNKNLIYIGKAQLVVPIHKQNINWYFKESVTQWKILRV